MWLVKTQKLKTQEFGLVMTDEEIVDLKTNTWAVKEFHLKVTKDKLALNKSKSDEWIEIEPRMDLKLNRIPQNDINCPKMNLNIGCNTSWSEQKWT